MKHLNAVIFSCFFMVFTGTASAYNQQALMDAYFSVVLIRGYNTHGGMAYGSGVVVAENEVITNCHVLRATKQPWISRGEDSYPITSVRADPWHDLCLVTTDKLPLKPVLLGNSQLQRGQEITAMGHSNGVPAPITSVGEVQGLYPMPQGNMIRSSAKFMMGASGSGLFDMEGRLIGINTFKTAGKGGSIHFALPVEWIQTLQALPASDQFPVSGKALWEEDEDKKPFYMRMAVAEVRKDWDRMADIGRTWTQQFPNSVDAWFAMGLAEQQLKHWPEAAQAYEHATQLDPNFIDAWFHQGEVAHLSGDTAQALSVESRLQALDPALIPMFHAYLACDAQCPSQTPINK